MFKPYFEAIGTVPSLIADAFSSQPLPLEQKPQMTQTLATEKIKKSCNRLLGNLRAEYPNRSNSEPVIIKYHHYYHPPFFHWIPSWGCYSPPPVRVYTKEAAESERRAFIAFTAAIAAGVALYLVLSDCFAVRNIQHQVKKLQYAQSYLNDVGHQKISNLAQQQIQILNRLRLSYATTLMFKISFTVFAGSLAGAAFMGSSMTFGGAGLIGTAVAWIARQAHHSFVGDPEAKYFNKAQAQLRQTLAECP